MNIYIVFAGIVIPAVVASLLAFFLTLIAILAVVYGQIGILDKAVGQIGAIAKRALGRHTSP